MWDVSLMDMVLLTLGSLLTIALICCICCISMKCSDRKMKNYIMDLAKKKGVKLDPDKLDPRVESQSPLAKENCSIFVPEVGIIL